MDVTLQPDTPLKTGTRTIFPYLYSGKVYWFSWTEIVDACNSPIPNDPYERVYFTGTDAPRYTRNDIAIGSVLPNASFKLGIPAPTQPIQAILGADKPDPDTKADPDNPDEPDIVDASDDESRLYVYTWVSSTGEEGPPSPVSNEVVLTDPEKNTVDLTLPAIGVNEQDIVKRRVYRTATSGGVTDFYLVVELDVATTSYNDALLTQDLGAVLVTGNYFPPPDKMIGLTSLPNGVLAGFVDNVFCPSYPNIPYAYNPDYQIACDSKIVAIAATPSGAVIGTEDRPYLIQGFTPDTYQYQKLETSAACVSARSMVDMGNSVIYASGRGLEMISGGEPVNLTIGMYTKEQWEALKPETFDAYEYKGKYVAFYNDGKKFGSLIFDPSGQDVTECEIFATAGYRMPTTENLFVVMNDKMNTFDSNKAKPLNMKWRSKLFITPPYRYRVCKVRGEDVSCTLIRDGELIKTKHLVAYDYYGYTFKVPKGRGGEWQVEISGTGMVRDIQLAPSKRELR
ncbi:hypothetical protein DMW20_11780 [Vibrio parahaemolyticus]|nr:hypothetical protein [Vibrio parahaemolyticus]